MNKALEEVATGVAGGVGYASGGKAVALPGQVETGNNNIFIIVLIIVILCVCSGYGGTAECCSYGKRRRRRRSGNRNLLLLLILGIVLLGNGSSGKNLNTNVINVNTLNDPSEGEDLFDF